MWLEKQLPSNSNGEILSVNFFAMRLLKEVCPDKALITR